LKGKEKWTDSSFTFPEAISWTELPSLPEYSIKDDIKWLEWRRLSEEYESSLYTMWGTEDIGVSDVI